MRREPRQAPVSRSSYLHEMLEALIIEDEQNNADRLIRLLEACCPEISVRSTCSTVAEGLAALREAQPDLLFLDIELPDGTGFDILGGIEDIGFDVIFTTAYDRYAIKAIKFSATDYLMKPVDREELRAAVDRVIANRQAGRPRANITFLKENVRNTDLDKIALPTSDGYRIVLLDDIIRCQSDANYTLFYLSDGKKLLVSRTLKEFDELLSRQQFCRVHHSHLINVRHAVQYRKGEGGTVVMSDGSEIEVSRRKKEQFLKMLPRA